MIGVEPERRHLLIGSLRIGQLPPAVPGTLQRTITEVPPACPHCRAEAIVEPTCRQCGVATRGRTHCPCGAVNEDREVRCLICSRHWYLISDSNGR